MGSGQRKRPTMFSNPSSFATAPTHRPLRDEIAPLLPALRARALKLSMNPTEAQDLVADTVERALRFGQIDLGFPLHFLNELLLRR